MAAIETLDGISRVNEFDYQVTKVVNIGANIDDLRDANFTIRDGGRMQFVTGCTTTFTRCTFTELKTMKVAQSTAAPTNNTNARFQGTTAPVFKGCKFLMADEMRSNSFDAVATSAPSFLYDEYKTPCYMFINNVFQNPQKQYWHWNTLASDKIVINGLIWDQKGPSGLAFDLPPSINNMTMVNNNPTSTSRHVNFLTRNWPANTTREIAGLTARNISTWGGDDTRTLVMVDCSTPAGEDIPRSSEPQAIDGRIIGKRTYKSIPFDPLSNASVSVKTYIKNKDNNTVAMNGYAAKVDEKLFSYQFAGGSRDIEYANEYIRGFYKYGTLPAVAHLTLNPLPAGQKYDDGNVLILPDTSITETDKSIVDAYRFSTEVSDSSISFTSDDGIMSSTWVTVHNLYDAMCANLEENWEAVDLRAIRTGNQLDFGNRSVSLTNLGVSGHLKTTGSLTLSQIDNGSTISGSQNVVIDTLPTSITVDNAVLNIKPHTDITHFKEVNGARYKATADGTYTARGKSASIIDANGFTITVITEALPTPSVLNFKSSGARWSIFDDNGDFVQSGSGDKVLNHRGGIDKGVWTIVSHKQGFAAQIDTWISDDDSNNLVEFNGAKQFRVNGGSAYTEDETPNVSVGLFDNKLRALVGNTSVEAQEVYNAQQNFINSDEGLSWVKKTGLTLPPTFGTLNGQTGYFNVEGFVYDSFAGLTPQSKINAAFENTASHDYGLINNGGTVLGGGVETAKEIANAVWLSKKSEYEDSDTMGALQKETGDYVRFNAMQLQPTDM